MASLWNGLLRNLVFGDNAVEEIIILKELIPLWITLKRVRLRTMGPGPPGCAEHGINRPAASIAKGGGMAREPARRERAARWRQFTCGLSRS